MNASAAPPASPSLSRDLWGGLAAMLVALPSSIAFGVLVFSAISPDMAGEGALFGMLGAAALGLVAPLSGGTAGLVSAPCAPSAAVLAGLAATLVAAGIAPPRVPGLLILAGLFAALLQVIYGLVRGGRFIKYIPYPVVSGYLSGVGLIIAIGQMPKLLGTPMDLGLVHALVSPANWRWPGIVVGLVTIGVMLTAPRVTRRVPAAIVGLVAGMIVYFILGAFLPDLMTINGNPLVIGPVKAAGSLIETVGARFQDLMRIPADDVRLVIYSALALSALLSIDTLKTCVVLDALTRGRHNSNRELLGQGIANLAAFCTGGMPGAGTMGPTLVNVTSGGHTRRSGFAEGVFVILAILALGPFIAWVPIGGLAGIMLVVAFRMFDWGAFGLLRHPETRFDFAVMATVVVVAETVGLIAASASGVGLAILLFIRDQIRGSVLRRRSTLKDTSSKTHRLQNERSILAGHGDEAGLYELQGNLFFGTTDQLFTELEPDIRTRKWLLLDMRRVQSMDYTAAHLFEQMRLRMQERGGDVLFCGMPSSLPSRQDIYRYLDRLGLVGERHGSIRVFETRDEALEWMEDQILSAHGWSKDDDLAPLDLREIELLRDLDDAALEQLRGLVHLRRVAAGGKVFSRGDEGDELFLIRSGGIRVLLPLAGGKRHHLATFGRGDFFGEMAFLDKGQRSADAEARGDTELYVLSRKEFNRNSRADPVLGVRTFARLARAVSLRLRQTDAELRALEER